MSTLKKKLLISAVSFAVTLLLLEVVLRVFLWPHITQIYHIDEQCLFLPTPSTSHYHHHVPPNDGPYHFVSIDDQGFRGPDGDPNRTLTDGAPRVLVYGDSFVMAEFSPYAETFTAQLEDQLRDALGKPCFVVNAGAAGAGPDQYLPRLDRDLPLVEPDVVIFAIYAGNDFGDLIRDKMFRIGDDGMVVPNTFTLSDRARTRFSFRDTTAIYRLVHWLRNARRMQKGWESMAVSDEAEMVAMAKRLVENDLRLCRDEFREFVTDGRNDVRTLLDDHYDSDLALEPESESAHYKVRLMEHVMTELVEKTRRAGVPVLFVSIPAPNDVIENYRGGIADTEKFPLYRASRLTDFVTGFAESLEAPCVDLFEPFRARGAELYLLAPDIHWNGAGQKLAAQLVRDRVISLLGQ